MRRLCCTDGIGKWYGENPRLPSSAWRDAAEPVSRTARPKVMKLLDDAQSAGPEAPVAACSKQMAEFCNFKYCIAADAFNSALFLALQSLGVSGGARVLGNAPVGSQSVAGVHHAGGEFVRVDCDCELAIDIGDLKAKAETSGAKVLLLSHICGMVPDVEAVVRVCAERGILILEDCGESVGILYQGKHVGQHGVVCCVSAHSESIINAGGVEGGFILTNADNIAMNIACMAGFYTKQYQWHSALPKADAVLEKRNNLPDYSMQMTNITAVILQPQVASLKSRTKAQAKNYQRLRKRFINLVGFDVALAASLHVPQNAPDVRCCPSRFAFLVDLGAAASNRLTHLTRSRGVPLETLGMQVTGAAGAMTRSLFGGTNNDNKIDASVTRNAYAVHLPPKLTTRQCDIAAEILAKALREASTFTPGEIAGESFGESPVEADDNADTGHAVSPNGTSERGELDLASTIDPKFYSESQLANDVRSQCSESIIGPTSLDAHNAERCWNNVDRQIRTIVQSQTPISLSRASTPAGSATFPQRARDWNAGIVRTDFAEGPTVAVGFQPGIRALSARPTSRPSSVASGGGSSYRSFESNEHAPMGFRSGGLDSDSAAGSLSQRHPKVRLARVLNERVLPSKATSTPHSLRTAVVPLEATPEHAPLAASTTVTCQAAVAATLAPPAGSEPVPRVVQAHAPMPENPPRRLGDSSFIELAQADPGIAQGVPNRRAVPQPIAVLGQSSGAQAGIPPPAAEVATLATIPASNTVMIKTAPQQIRIRPQPLDACNGRFAVTDPGQERSGSKAASERSARESAVSMQSTGAARMPQMVVVKQAPGNQARRQLAYVDAVPLLSARQIAGATTSTTSSTDMGTVAPSADGTTPPARIQVPVVAMVTPQASARQPIQIPIRLTSSNGVAAPTVQLPNGQVVNVVPQQAVQSSQSIAAPQKPKLDKNEEKVERHKMVNSGKTKIEDANSDDDLPPWGARPAGLSLW